MSTITSKDGTKIYYKDWGKGPVVTFSHGWPLNADAWDGQMLFLAQNGFRVVAHDRRGHGRSSQASSGNDMNGYADDLAAVIEALDIKDATLVGHSTGGGEVARYIGRHGTKRVAKAVLIAANTLPRIFPMLTTAAGTITPSRVFVIGAGVAGLQAIATARRLGAVASAYDLRPAAKEQVQSLGGRFVELPIEAKDAQDERGYGRAQDETFYAHQRELLGRVVAESDVVITAAVIPGKKSPVLVTGEMVHRMAPGSVIFDLASERGGNCELTRRGETVVEHGVSIIGAINLASGVPYHASQMYARNVTAFLLHLVKDNQLQLNLQDEIFRETLITRDGEIVNERVREFFALPGLASVSSQEKA